MQLFFKYDPRTTQTEYTLLRFFKSPQEEQGEDFYFIKKDSHLLVYTERLHIFPATSKYYGEQKLLADQFEIPLNAVRWFINVIEKKFCKPPEEGGLIGNKISYEEVVAGENLHVMRSTTAGCPHAGYLITNGSRRSHMDADEMQTLALSDPWLFQNGLMGYLKSLANDFEQDRL